MAIASKNLKAAVVSIVFTCLGLVCLGGCSAPPAGEPQSRLISADKDLVWASCCQVVRQYGFEPYLVQPGRGLILTEPQTSAQWFEFWRKDAATMFALTESSLHTIRRHIRLEMEATTDTQARVTCGVMVEQLHRRDDPGSLRHATNIYAQPSSSSIPARQLDSSVIEWIPLGYDPTLQQNLLDDICRRCSL